MVKLTVVVVAFRNMECLSACLASIPYLPWIEVIVVNNSHQNRGFSAGCNMGARIARGEYLLFLNPDCIVDEEALSRFIEVLKHDDTIGIVGPKLMNAQGKAYVSCNAPLSRSASPLVYSFLNKFLKNFPLVRNYWYNNTPPKEVTTVGSVCGAALGMRKAVFDQVNGFDTRFFLYWEEFDLAIRVARQDLRVVFDPSITLIHEGELSTVQPRLQVLRWFRESRFYFFKKHFGSVYAALLEGWLTFSEEWRYVLALILTVGLSFWFYLYGWWLHPVYFPYWDFLKGVGLSHMTAAYWLGVGGTLFFLTMLYNELTLSRWNIFMVSILFTSMVVLFPTVGLGLLILGLVWTVIDLHNSLLWLRKGLVIFSLGLVGVSAVITSVQMIRYTGFSASLQDWMQVTSLIKRSDESVSIRCVGCVNEKEMSPLIWLLSKQGVVIDANSNNKLYLIVPPYSDNGSLLPDAVTIRAGSMVIAKPLSDL